MKLTRQIFSLVLLLSFTTIAISQSNSNMLDKRTLDNGSLDEQFQYIIKKSNRYQHYKVVKRAWLDKVRVNVSDSILSLKASIEEQHAYMSKLNSEISQQNQELSAVNNNLNEVTAEKDNMAFLGFPMTKKNYRITMWSIIGLCTGLFLIFLFKFKRSNRITRSAKNSLQEIQNELESFRKRAREKEQLLKREIQNELNKRMDLEKAIAE